MNLRSVDQKNLHLLVYSHTDQKSNHPLILKLSLLSAIILMHLYENRSYFIAFLNLHQISRMFIKNLRFFRIKIYI